MSTFYRIGVVLTAGIAVALVVARAAEIRVAERKRIAERAFIAGATVGVHACQEGQTLGEIIKQSKLYIENVK